MWISEREISRSCQVSRSTIADYLEEPRRQSYWPEASLLPENQIEERLFPQSMSDFGKASGAGLEYIYNQLRTFQKFKSDMSHCGSIQSQISMATV